MKDNVVRLGLASMAREYREQTAIYEEMRRLALEQEKCLQQPEVDTDLLMELLNRRQEMINSLEERNRNMGQLKEEIRLALGIDEFTIGQISACLNAAEIEELAESMEKLSMVLVEIKELDRKNEQAMRHHIQETAGKLNRLQHGRKARKAYQPGLVNKDGVFIDYSK
ncbi:MAG: flagellar export chaperone FlgN [Peptococcaceae bacterium]|nr:flagellar protein FlgN [Peptococcaceae bacterium]MDH7524774.1 flagellar export chaperone FlgN [Peptococcaceae bacterium]